jgi:hypothetical protein
VSAVVLDPVERRDGRGLDLRILIPGLNPGDSEDAHNAVLRAMDHGIGEEQLAESVQGTEVRPLPQGAAQGELVPLTELDAFLEWRSRKLQGAG